MTGNFTSGYDWKAEITRNINGWKGGGGEMSNYGKSMQRG